MGNKNFTAPACETCTSRHTSIFADLDGGELVRFSFQKGCNLYKSGNTIFNEGSYPSGLYCIHKGKVKIFKNGTEGKEQILRFAKEGDILGYKSLLSDQPFSASAAALDEAVICFIPKKSYFDVLQTNPKLSLKMMQLLTQELKTAETRIVELAQKPVRERLAETILILKETFGFEEDGKTIAISLTREEIANIVGTATESVIRLLSEFKKDGIIDLKGRSISILDNRELVRTANIDD
ncbi:MAG TPA: Crp/Fnr family transcriptional regulator [Patescibacteria group bacterium]|nr:Crp/Fnr family transcriptional regulator [Patescibacteria group bacterium]